MTWFKVDDLMHGHPKARRAGLAAIGLWTVAGSAAMAYKLDGQVDRGFVLAWPQGSRLAARLVEVGLWHGHGHGCLTCPQPLDGWVFHDWSDFQPTSDEIERKREHDRKRQREWRAKRMESREASGE